MMTLYDITKRNVIIIEFYDVNTQNTLFHAVKHFVSNGETFCSSQ